MEISSGPLEETGLLHLTEVNASFHSRLAAATRNTYIEAYSNKLHNVARRLSYFILQREAEHFGLSADLFEKPRRDHESIIAAIGREDREGLVESLTDHAMLFRTRLVRIINEGSSSTIDFGGLANLD